MITRPAPVAPAKIRASSHIRRLAKEVQRTFPDMTVHQHLTDAARENDAGRTDNAKRHLDAAVASFAPLQLIRHGIHDDEGHRAAKNFMQQAHRGRLLVQDTEGIRGENDGLMERRRDQAASALQARAMRNAQPQPTGRVDRAVAVPGTIAANRPALGPGTAKQYANGPEPYRRGEDETVQCPNCGKYDAPDARYCDQCGKPLPASAFADLAWDGILFAIELAGKTPPHETQAGRAALQRKGQTAYGKSFPVPNLDYLRKAIHSIGRAPASKRGRLKSFLKRRASALGAPALTANLTADELAMIDLAVVGQQVIDLVGPKGYIHGWIKVGEQAAAKAARPLSREGRAERSLGRGGGIGLRSRLQRRARGGWGDPFQASKGKLGQPWQPRGETGPFGKHLSKKEAAGFADMFRQPKGKRKEQSSGELGRLFQPGQVTETVASGAGMPEDNRQNPFTDESLRMQWAMQHPQATSQAAKQAQTYQALRATGHSHSAAMNIVRGTFRQISRAFQAGKVTESITQYAWEDVLDAIELSAQTGRLASEPHPFGKPGGPGLWNVKGMELPPYIQNIARALLRTGRAKDLSQAIAIAKGATNRWAVGKNTSPEVRAASAKTNASWAAKQATAHAHANDWDHLVDLTGTAAGAAKDSRTPLGQFGTGGAAGGAKPAQSRAQRKAALLAQAKQDRAQAKLLLIRIAADRRALASASGKVTKGQKGSVTKATAKTGSTAPKAKGAAAAASPTSAKSTGLTPAQTAKATASATAAAGKMSKAQLTAAIKTLSAQEKNLLAAAAKAVQQASKL